MLLVAFRISVGFSLVLVYKPMFKCSTFSSPRHTSFRILLVYVLQFLVFAGPYFSYKNPFFKSDDLLVSISQVVVLQGPVLLHLD